MTKARHEAGEQDGAPVRVLGVASGLGGRDPGAALGPAALRRAGIVRRLRARGTDAAWSGTIAPAPGPHASAYDAIAPMCSRLAARVGAIVTGGARPLVLGGDHACAVGTWSGVRAALPRPARLGLVWIDAHLDSHTPQTSHTGRLYGMPLAALLGYGDPRLTGCGFTGPKLLPGDVAIVGARSYESEERALLDRVGVRVIGMDEISRRGVAWALAEAVAIASRRTAAFGITLDLDAIDPRDAPGVGTPAVDGLRAAPLVAALDTACAGRAPAALEIVELNPGRDRGGVTCDLAIELAGAVLAPEQALVGTPPDRRAA